VLLPDGRKVQPLNWEFDMLTIKKPMRYVKSDKLQTTIHLGRLIWKFSGLAYW